MAIRIVRNRRYWFHGEEVTAIDFGSDPRHVLVRTQDGHIINVHADHLWLNECDSRQ